MMRYRIVNQAIIDTLGAAATGRFRVLGYRGQGKDAVELRGNKRSVQVVFQSSDFTKGSSGLLGPATHDMTFLLILTVSAPAKVNLNVINAPNATPEQISIALAGMQDAAYEADAAMDELFEMAYQIVMDARNLWMGLERGEMSDRWVEKFEKDEPLPQGMLVTLTARMVFTCKVSEDIVGDIPVPADRVIDLGLDLSEGDFLVKAGILSATRIELGVVTFNGDVVTYGGEEVTFGGY